MRLAVVALLLVVAFAFAQNNLSDGCIYYQGSLFGCLKSRVFDCDQDWMFQLITPVSVGEQSDASYSNYMWVLAQGVVFSGNDFYDCYSRGLVSFCLSFSNVQIVDAVMQTDTTITIESMFNTTTIDLGVVTIPGAPCGTTGYFYTPCTEDIPAVNETFPVLVGMELNYYFSNPSVAEYSSVLYYMDPCIYLIPHSCLAGGCMISQYLELFCPDLMMDTCDPDGAGILQSYSGYFIQMEVRDENIACESVLGGQFCVYIDSYSSYDTTLDVTGSIQIYTPEGNLLGYELPLYLYRNFPECGGSTWDSCTNFYTNWWSNIYWLSLSDAWSPSPTSHSPSSHSPSSKSSNKHHKSSNSSNGDDGASAGLITGLVLGGLLVAVLVIVVIAIVGYRFKGPILARLSSMRTDSADMYATMLSEQASDIQ